MFFLLVRTKTGCGDFMETKQNKTFKGIKLSETSNQKTTSNLKHRDFVDFVSGLFWNFRRKKMLFLRFVVCDDDRRHPTESSTTTKTSLKFQAYQLMVN